MLILTAEPGETFDSLELTVEGVGMLPDGSTIVRKAEGPGMIVNVAGASEQGAVDRQRIPDRAVDGTRVGHSANETAAPRRSK